MTRYEYSVLDKELQEIRLLDLLPGAFDAPIRGILRTKSFTENTVPEYEALSYTWGSTENSQTIEIGDAPFDITTIEVTRNLAQALPYLRLETEPRVLWIDAICVNQQDLKERGSQVKRMPDLYSKARRVVVWLGPEGVQSIIAMNLLQDMGSKIVVDWNAYNYTSVSGSTQGAEFEPYKDGEARLTYSQVEMSAIFEILQRSWFERLWIVQEICLAPPNTILQCGKTCIYWTEFSNAVFLLHTKRWKWYDPLQEQSIRARLINIVAFLRTKYRTFNTFRGLLEDTKKQQCSDPRDRIYAILSLATDLNFEPDYTKSTNETFKAVMLSYLSSTRALDTVVSAGCQKKSGHGPSWVPDWSALPSLNPIPQHLASGESEATCRCEGDMLLVQGIYVGTVSRAEPFLLSESIKRDYHSIAEEVRRVVLLVLAGLAGPESKFIKTNRVAALARTLIPNALADDYYPEDQNDPNSEETQEFLVDLLEVENSTEARNKNGYTARCKRILDHIQYFCCGRSLYTTEKGEFGLGAQTVEGGDHVAVFLGSNLPVALRPTSPGKWQVLGETYLNGFGDGEAVLGPLPDNTRVVSRLDDKVESWAYLSVKTGALNIEDPRLKPLHGSWTRKKHPEDHRWTWYVNTGTGEERGKEFGDPRLDFGEMLKADNLLQEFSLV